MPAMTLTDAIAAALAYELNDELSNLPRKNSTLVKTLGTIEAIASEVDDYCDISRADYDAGEDGTDDYRADKEMAWDDVVRAADCLTDEDIY